MKKLTFKSSIAYFTLLTISLMVKANTVQDFYFKVSPFNESTLENMSWGHGRPESPSALSPYLKACLSDIEFVYRVAPYTDVFTKGVITVNNDLIDDLRMIFKRMYDEPAFSMTMAVPIHAFDWEDKRSMRSNNTSGFNFRYISGTRKLSNHSKGRAIDINPRVNPWVSKNGVISPLNGSLDPEEPGSLLPGSPAHYIVRLFKSKGWIWGGDWNSVKDYQHFEKRISYPGNKYCQKPNE